MLKVGVIGAGRMGRIRALAAKALGAEVAYIFDQDLSRAEALARLVNAQTMANGNDLCLDELDALFLCTPPSVRNVGVTAIHADVHLLVEKPLGLRADCGLKFVEALNHHHVVTAVGYMNRYREGVLQAKAILETDDALGLTMHWFGGRYGVSWWSDPDQSGGPINEQCSHLVDLCRYLLGEIETVQALAPNDIRTPETVALNLRFASGKLGTLFYSCQSQEKTIGLTIVTNKRTIQLEGWDFRSPEDIHPAKDKNAIFTIETKCFFDAITGGDEKSVLSDIPDALRTQKTVDAIIQSTIEGRAIEVI